MQEDFCIECLIGVDAQDFAHAVAVIAAGVKIAERLPQMRKRCRGSLDNKQSVLSDST